MNTGFPQGKTQTFQLPPGGYVAAPVFAGNPFATPDPYMRQIWGQGGAYGGGAGNPLGGGSGGGMPGTGYGAGTGYQQARADNMALADELKTGFQGRYERGLAELKKLEGVNIPRINRSFDQNAARIRSAYAGGMSGNQSTIVQRQLEKNEADRQEALAIDAARTAQMRIATDADLSGDALGQRERINLGYPDLGQWQRAYENLGEGDAPTAPMPTPQPGPAPPPTAYPSFQMTPAEQKQANRMQSYDDSRKKKAARRAYEKPQPPATPAYMTPQPYVETPETAAMMATTRATFAPPAASQTASQATATPTRLPPGVRPIFYQPPTSQLAPYSGAPSATDPQAWAANALRGYQTPLTQRPAQRSAYGFSQAPYSNVPMPSVIGVNQEIARDMARRRKRT